MLGEGVAVRHHTPPGDVLHDGRDVVLPLDVGGEGPAVGLRAAAPGRCLRRRGRGARLRGLCPAADKGLTTDG